MKELFLHLQDYLERGVPLTKAQLWQKIFPQQTFEEQQLRLLMSYLSKLFEQFVTVEASLKSPYERKMNVVQHLSQRSEPKLQAIWLKEADKILKKQPFRHAEYLFHSYEHQLEVARLSTSFRPDKSLDFPAIGAAFEQAVLAVKLRQKVWSLNLFKVYQQEETPGLFDTFIDGLTVEDIGDQPAILVYWYATKFLENPTEEVYFQSFKSLLLKQSHLFPHEEARELYLLAINFGVRRVNESHRSFFYDIMDIYKEGLRQEYLLSNGVLSRFTYHNIVAGALQIKETEWAKAFLEEWTIKLERRFRDRMYNFNSAKIAYATQQYDEALGLLQQANYHDPLLNLGARALLLKIYFEQEEWDALHSHLDAFQSYLRRKADLGYHRTNYRNFIRLTKRILNTNLRNPNKVAQLKTKIENEKLLTEKDWLLGRL